MFANSETSCGMHAPEAPSFRRPRRLFDDRRDLLGVQKKYYVASGKFERLGLGSAGHESFEVGTDLTILRWNHRDAGLFRPCRNRHLVSKGFGGDRHLRD